MSGGSFNYLYCRDVSDLFDSTEDLEKMEQYLIEHGYNDVAKDTRRLIEYVASSRIRIEVLQGLLKDVFKAAEWCSNGDWNKKELVDAVEKYRRIE